MTKEEFDKLYKNTEGKLFSYKYLEGKIENKKIEILKEKNEFFGCTGIRYDGIKTSKTYNIPKSIELELITKEKKINKLEYEKNDLEYEKREIEIAINNFSMQQKELFEILYMSKRVRVSRREITSKMHISKTTYYELRKSLVVSAINSMHPKILIDEIYTRMVN